MGDINVYNKYKLMRRGRKLNLSDDPRIVLALPKDVQERTWSDILQKEEVDLFIFDIREEILEIAIGIHYERYMDKQTTAFTVHCAAKAWLNLINWNFFRHDPGEEQTAYPPCYIPNRASSWIPDEIPHPSPKDTWTREELDGGTVTSDEGVQKSPSGRSLNFPVIEDIPKEYWFPGKVNLPSLSPSVSSAKMSEDQKDYKTSYETSGEWGLPESKVSHLGADSEILQKVTDYSEELQEELTSSLKTSSPQDGSLHGAGDSTLLRLPSRPTRLSKIRSVLKTGRSSKTLPPLTSESKSRVSIISDCRLRNLRLDTQFEISSERMQTPLGEAGRRK